MSSRASRWRESKPALLLDLGVDLAEIRLRRLFKMSGARFLKPGFTNSSLENRGELVLSKPF